MLVLDTLTNYCHEAGVANIFYVIKIFFNILQIVVPTLLIVSAMISLMGLMATDPDDKKKKKKLLNKVIAAIVVFLIPVMVNLTMSALGTGGIKDKYNIADCWSAAETVHKNINYNNSAYDDSESANTIYGNECLSLDGTYDTTKCIQRPDGKWYQCTDCNTSTTHESSSGVEHGGTSGSF